MRFSSSRSAAAFCTLLVAASTASGTAAAPPPGQAEFFEKKIRPLLAERCYSCHSASAEKLKAHFRLDTAEGLLAGGDRGPAITPGKPDESLLLQAVRWEIEDVRMPPKAKLSAQEISDLTAWVRMGAPFPGSPPPRGQSATAAKPASNRSHWAFEPIRDTPPPPLKNRALQAWAATPLDQFIAGELDRKKLRPSPPADKRTLIRRATFDLTGLPPTRREIESFLRDRSPDAFARVVDRLLASPHYGEQWGRHWLDVARYADSNGFDENVAHGSAWRYRDYVVEMFNHDLPFNDFITEQVAGDLLQSPTRELRNRRLIATGFLAMGPKALAEPDKVKMEMDIVDEQIDTMGKAFLGLTLGCARCHDHKFDPIPTRDYYALAGIFKSTRTMESLVTVAKWHEHSLATPEDLERFKVWTNIFTAQQKASDSLKRSSNDELQKSLRASAPDYLVAAAAVAISQLKGADVAASRRLDLKLLERWQQHLATARTNAGSPLVSWHEFVTARDLAGVETWARQFGHQLTLAFHEDPAMAALRKLADDPAGPLSAPPDAERLYPETAQRELKKARADLAAWTEKRPDLPAAMGVANGTTTNLQVHLRGSPLTLGERVPRGFVQVANRTKHTVSDNAGGRIELAQWLTDPENPLTARVIVNRVWRWHFGRGLVATPDNFGRLGEAPTHPGLLDWLARDFVAGNWTLKKLHRTILLSATYRMGSSPSGRGLEVDPENHYYWRMNGRRLTGEEIRDSLLQVSGTLDTTFGGTLLGLRSHEFVFNHTSKDATRYLNRRRSIYQPVIRNHVYDMLALFDFPDPAVTNGDRPSTTIAPQALLMLNSDIVLDQSAKLAGRFVPDAGPAEGRVDELFQLALARPATALEQQRCVAFLKRERAAGTGSALERETRAWEALAQVILCSNEFIYVP